MPIEFYELPQGTPSVAPVTTGTGYTSASDVVSLVKSRANAIGLPQQPSLTDIDGYIVMIAGQIDGILLGKGYQVPVNVASHPEVEGLLSWVNAQGAAWMMEVSAPSSVEIDRLRAAYDNAIDMLTEGKFALDADAEVARAGVRAPFVTYQPTGQTYDPTFAMRGGAGGDGISGARGCNNPRNPFFSRQVRF